MIAPKITTVSIVTPSFQQRPFIESTLRSVLEQEGDFELDYIVVDGGSTDGTVEVLQDFEQQVKSGRWKTRCRKIDFRWSSQKDRGQSDAINKGFAQSRGDVMAWLNSDDIYLDARVITKVVDHFRRRSSVQLLYGKGYGIDREGRVLRQEDYVTEFPIEDLPEIDMILQPAAFWRREVWEAIGELNTGLHFVMDWEYWLRCAAHYRLEFFDEFLACNRLYETNKTLSGGIARKREIAELLLTRGNFTERAIQSYLAAPQAPQGAPLDAKPQRTLRKMGRYLEQRVRGMRDRLLGWKKKTA